MTAKRARPTPAFRLVRGALLGASSAVLAVAAHGMAGGGLPNAAVTIVLTVLVAWAGTSIAASPPSLAAVSRPPSLPRMLALLGASQVSLHLLLTYASSHSEIALSPAMLATHAVATCCTAVLLTRASTALDVIAAAIVGLVRALLWEPHQPEPTTRPAHVDTVGHLLDVVLRKVCARRGPPLFS